ncbi:MAG: peptidoglycan DD-metalloendopeptidase family protein [Clostridia bacterium]|nr:peptidoglycan DD-metalloendopeptidase family protein [Clostridia bacterium]
MSKITDSIFKLAKIQLTSPFGKRNVIKTSAGDTSSFHSGTDYGTFGLKLPQFAIDDGYIMQAATATDGAKFVWIIYPKLKLAMLHYHLDSFCVKTGQQMKKGEKIGNTGRTGKATGIHLHLGIKPLDGVKDLAKVTHAVLDKISYIDPESVSFGSFLPDKGYFALGDKSSSIGKVASWMRKIYPAYTSAKALGDTLGPYLTAAIREYQKRRKLPINGRIDKKTLDDMKTQGFKP